MRVRPLRSVLPVAAVAFAAAAPSAHAARADVAGGTTTVKLDRGTAAALAGAGVSVAPAGAARATGARVRFPVSGGRIDPATGAGRLDHRGGLRFSAAGRSVRLSALRIRGVNLSAVAGGKRVHVLKLRTGDARVRRTATTTRVTRVRAELTAKAAAALTRRSTRRSSGAASSSAARP